MTKKILAIVLSVVLGIAVLSLCASAEGTPAGNESMTVTVTTDAETYLINETVTVNVSITSNYNITAFLFPIMFDASVYEIPTLINLTTYNTCKTSGTIGSNTANDGTYIPSNYTASDFGCVLVQWTASVTGGAVGTINNTDGELCFSFNLKAKSSAVGKTGTIFIPAESDKFYYQAIQTPTDATTIYYLTKDTVSMSFIPANATVVGEDVKLIPNADYDSTAVINEDRLYVYGLEQGISTSAEIKTFVKATGNGTIRTTSTEYGMGTGAKINLQIDGVTVKTYRVIIFGDVNGDAMIDNNDLGTIELVAISLEEFSEDFSSPEEFAADVVLDEIIDGFDYGVVELVALGLEDIDQVNPY